MHVKTGQPSIVLWPSASHLLDCLDFHTENTLTGTQHGIFGKICNKTIFQSDISKSFK